jgi:phosphate starvation-inducible PhoH-like protein
MRKTVTPRTPNQTRYLKALQNASKPIVIATGPPGSGKTMFPCQVAAEMLSSGGCQKIVLTRPLVCVGADLGYLPGSIENKMDPWTRPMFDILENYFVRSRIKQLIEDRRIEISPLAYMRGRTFQNSFIIADEMQNSTKQELKLVLTRLGLDSQMVIAGDPDQCDLEDPYTSGLSDILSRLEGYSEQLEYIEQVVLGSEDIQRHEAIQEICGIYQGDLSV